MCKIILCGVRIRVLSSKVNVNLRPGSEVHDLKAVGTLLDAR